MTEKKTDPRQCNVAGRRLFIYVRRQPRFQRWHQRAGGRRPRWLVGGELVDRKLRQVRFFEDGLGISNFWWTWKYRQVSVSKPAIFSVFFLLDRQQGLSGTSGLECWVINNSWLKNNFTGWVVVTRCQVAPFFCLVVRTFHKTWRYAPYWSGFTIHPTISLYAALIKAKVPTFVFSLPTSYFSCSQRSCASHARESPAPP